MLVGACLLLVDKKTGKILSLSRRNNPSQFSMPGGKVEEGETPVQGLCREIYEELGWFIAIYESPIIQYPLSISIPKKDHTCDVVSGRHFYTGEEIGDFVTHCYFAEGFDLKNVKVNPEEGFLYRWLTWDQLCDPVYSPFWEFNSIVRIKYFQEQN